MIDLEKVLDSLSRERPVFHSEADFQHALALRIYCDYPDINIRLEKRLLLCKDAAYVDIHLSKDSYVVPLEIKYKTKKLTICVRSEEFNLKNQSAHDISRYDCVKDISRLEIMSKSYREGNGYMIFLTNDPAYWRPPRKPNANDKDFRIHDDRIIAGELQWQKGTSEGTMRGRTKPLVLEQKYSLKWRDYANLHEKNAIFKYLLVKVG